MDEVPDNYICPVCYEILTFPVRLPCDHVFCQACLMQSFDANKLECPICRKRVGTWLRRNKSFKIDEILWRAIEKDYPESDRKQLNRTSTVNKPIIKLSQPGEIREEFEQQRQKEEELQRVRREKELEMNERCLQMIEEEDRKESERLQMKKDEQLKKDEEMARQLAAEEEAEAAKLIHNQFTPERKISQPTPGSNISIVSTLQSSPSTLALCDTSDATDSSPFKTSTDFDNFVTGDGVAYLGPASPPPNWRDIPSTSRMELFKCSMVKSRPGDNKSIPCLGTLKQESLSSAELLRSAEISNKVLSDFTVVVPKTPKSSAADATEPPSRCSSGADSISPELHHFKPIRVSPTTPPKAGLSECLPQVVTAQRSGECPGDSVEPTTSGGAGDSVEPMAAEPLYDDYAHLNISREDIEYSIETEQQLIADFNLAKTLEQQFAKDDKKKRNTIVFKSYNLRKNTKRNLRKHVLLDRAQKTLDNMLIK